MNECLFVSTVLRAWWSKHSSLESPVRAFQSTVPDFSTELRHCSSRQVDVRSWTLNSSVRVSSFLLTSRPTSVPEMDSMVREYHSKLPWNDEEIDCSFSLSRRFVHSRREIVRPSVIAHVFFSGCRGDHCPLPCISFDMSLKCTTVLRGQNGEKNRTQKNCGYWRFAPKKNSFQRSKDILVEVGWPWSRRKRSLFLMTKEKRTNEPTWTVVRPTGYKLVLLMSLFVWNLDILDSSSIIFFLCFEFETIHQNIQQVTRFLFLSVPSFIVGAFSSNATKERSGRQNCHGQRNRF